MIKRILLALVLLFICVVIYNRVFNGPKAVPTLGTYAYNCQNGSSFSMHPASNMMSVQIMPGTNADFQRDNTLMKVPTPNGAMYQGNGITFKALGETVTLQTTSTTTDCSPVPSQDEAPFNFGD